MHTGSQVFDKKLFQKKSNKKVPWKLRNLKFGQNVYPLLKLGTFLGKSVRVRNPFFDD